MRNEMKILGGSSNQPLLERICAYTNVNPTHVEISRFADGEINMRIEETVRGHDVFLIQSTSPPVNDNLMELLIIIDALKRASANTIAVVIPYYGYARQDRKARGRDPITAKLVANLLTVAGATRVLTVDLHSEQIQGFFDIPLDNLQAFPVFVEALKKNEIFDKDKAVIVAPDVGAVKRARKFAEKIGLPIAILDKRRPKENVAEILHIIGDVEGMVSIMFDDMIDTGRTLMEGAKLLKQKGSTRVIACATHGVFSQDCLEALDKSSIDRIYVTDTISHEKLPEKVKVVSIAPLLGEAMVRIRKNLSISILFK
jgi:ribose-phosphate pyrophosphokinase|uniref:Ribose-phosphate pyrophosphokinase n=1 Tax=Mesoaciditoga lauensis TaxID=1495039 RepID=A0A7V3VST9_9BACT